MRKGVFWHDVLIFRYIFTCFPVLRRLFLFQSAVTCETSLMTGGETGKAGIFAALPGAQREAWIPVSPSRVKWRWVSRLGKLVRAEVKWTPCRVGLYGWGLTPCCEEFLALCFREGFQQLGDATPRPSEAILHEADDEWSTIRVWRSELLMCTLCKASLPLRRPQLFLLGCRNSYTGFGARGWGQRSYFNHSFAKSLLEPVF